MTQIQKQRLVRGRRASPPPRASAARSSRPPNFQFKQGRRQRPTSPRVPALGVPTARAAQFSWRRPLRSRTYGGAQGWVQSSGRTRERCLRLGVRELGQRWRPCLGAPRPSPADPVSSPPKENVVPSGAPRPLRPRGHLLDPPCGDERLFQGEPRALGAGFRDACSEKGWFPGNCSAGLAGLTLQRPLAGDGDQWPEKQMRGLRWFFRVLTGPSVWAERELGGGSHTRLPRAPGPRRSWPGSRPPAGLQEQQVRCCGSWPRALAVFR
ncbi:hypothetical protein P7K49_026206, partial [Saguinus oedipus]